MNQAYMEALAARMAHWSETERRLKAQGAQDEASFARIRYNISEVCRTVYTAFMKTAEADARYQVKIAEFEKTWSAAMDKARRHGDVEKACIEEIKLEELRAVTKLYHDTKRT